MTPYDKWNSTDIASHTLGMRGNEVRTAEQLDAMPMPGEGMRERLNMAIPSENFIWERIKQSRLVFLVLGLIAGLVIAGIGG